MTRRETAIANFMKGYNCSQSIVLAFADLVQIDESKLLKMASSFGGGMGRLREVCGAVSGMFMIAGLLCGYDGPETGEVKAEHYARIQELAKKFEEKHGTIVCREMLGLSVRHDAPVPEARTKEYYQKRPCAEIIGDAAEILEDFLKATVKADQKSTTIVEITDPNEKQSIARNVLEALTDWFEVEESREEYISGCADWTFFAANQGSEAVGFLCLKETGRSTVELAVMGVLKDYHRSGIGRQLVERAKETARSQGYEFMQVKTVKMGMYEDYDRTNLFYISCGFKELELFPLLWDKANPCQIYVMSLK